MELFIYSIYDKIAKAYNQPFFLQNDALAVRAFSTNVNSPDSQISKVPEEFTLYCLGAYDDSDGHLYPFTEPRLVIQAIHCHDGEKEQDKTELIYKEVERLSSYVHRFVKLYGEPQPYSTELRTQDDVPTRRS